MRHFLFGLKLLCVITIYLSNMFAFSQVANVSNEKYTMQVEGNSLKIPFYASQDIFTQDNNVNKAVIVIHGTNRNADSYFNSMETAANTVPALTANTVIVSPQFLIEDDIDFHNLDDEHLYWSSGGWKSGANSKNNSSNPRPARISSYAVIDSLMFHLTSQFPNMQSIVLSGHSAGGQLTQRVAATSPVATVLCSDLNISTRFVVMNPSSYAYMDGQRHVEGTTNTFAIPPNPCATYNEWRYGLDDLFIYPSNIGADAIRNQYRNRVVTYLVGENDNDPNSSSLGTGCESAIQGTQRLERATIFFNYLQHYYGSSVTATQNFATVPNTGHNSFDMFNSDEGVFALFEASDNYCETLGLDQSVAEITEIKFFPNPVEDVLIVNMPLELQDQITHINVYDSHGRLALTKKMDSDSSINTKALTSGIYFVHITVSDMSFYKKIIVR